jgi:hypothetical protein
MRPAFARIAAGDGGESGGEVRAVPKDEIRFALKLDGGAEALLVIRVRRDRFGGFAASALLHPAGAASPRMLGRVFRAREHRLAAGKMVAWVCRRYPHAQPLAERGHARNTTGA